MGSYQNFLTAFNVPTAQSITSKKNKNKTCTVLKKKQKVLQDEAVDVQSDSDVEPSENLYANDPFHIHFDEVNYQRNLEKSSKNCIEYEENGLRISAPKKIHPTTSLENRKIKKRVLDCLGKKELTDMQSLLCSSMEAYSDLLACVNQMSNLSEIREIYCLHALNHTYKTRDTILKNNESLKGGKEGEFRDQGFTRPKVLILAPFKSSALAIVNQLLVLSGTSEQANKNRFNQEYSLEEEVDQQNLTDQQKLFAGNNDDCFRVGIKFSRKVAKIYSDFYSSDIIVASPLGLRIVVGSAGDAKRDFDFLSSIELLIVDQANIINMQNWEHLQHIIQHLNVIPKESHDADFTRIRSTFLDGNGSKMRQTVLLSEYNFPELNAMFRSLSNVEGKCKITYKPNDIISKIHLPITQTFQKIVASNITTADDERFEYFQTKLLTSLQNSLNPQHICIFVASYLEFVRIRNYMTDKSVSFTFISEYSTDPEIIAARSQFFNGHVNILVITERFHFYRRFNIRGIQQIVFYSLPENSAFYPHLLSMLQDDKTQSTVEMTSLALFNRYDLLKLERLLGAKKSSKMILHDKNTFILSNYFQ